MPAVEWTPEILIQAVIAVTGSNREAATLLGISRDTVHKVRDGGYVKSQAAKDKIWNNYREIAAGADNPFRSEVGNAVVALDRFKRENRPRIVQAATTPKGHDEFLARVATEREHARKAQKSKKGRREWRDRYRSDPKWWKK